MWEFFKKKVVKPFQVPTYIIINVDNFNLWFNNPNNGATYAHPGIFLRLDKLSLAHIWEYMENCYGIERESLISLGYDVSGFERAIRQDWLNKLKTK
jgi:hypothetical protein